MNATELSASETHTIDEVDQWLTADRPRVAAEEPPQPTSLERLLPLLRAVGSILIIAAAAAFLIQGWSQSSHALRYLSFLGFTVAISGAGLLCAARFADTRSARSLLAVSAAIVPVHFCQLGGLVFSRFGDFAPASPYPAWLRWHAASTTEALGLTGLGTAALTVVILLAFATLLRPAARQAAVAYLLCNAALLLPVRSPNVVAGVLLALFALNLWTDGRVTAHGPAARTTEGLFVRIMLVIPALLLALRTIHLYDWSFLLTGALLAGLGVVVIEVAPPTTKSGAMQALLQYAGALTAVAAWGSIAREIWVQLLAMNFLNPELAFPLLTALPLPLLLIALSRRTPQVEGPVLHLAGALAILFGLIGQCAFGGPLTVAVALSACIATFAGAFLLQSHLLIWLSASALLFSVWHSFGELILESPWISLGAAGLFTLIGTAALQKHFAGRGAPPRATAAGAAR